MKNKAILFALLITACHLYAMENQKLLAIQNTTYIAIAKSILDNNPRKVEIIVNKQKSNPENGQSVLLNSDVQSKLLQLAHIRKDIIQHAVSNTGYFKINKLSIQLGGIMICLGSATIIDTFIRNMYSNEQCLITPIEAALYVTTGISVLTSGIAAIAYTMYRKDPEKEYEDSCNIIEILNGKFQNISKKKETKHEAYFV